MSLTDEDLTKIGNLIDTKVDSSIKANNEALFARIFAALQNFATKDELKAEIDKCATKEAVNEIRDDVVGLRADFRHFKTFVEGNQTRLEKEVAIVKAKLGFV